MPQFLKHRRIEEFISMIKDRPALYNYDLDEFYDKELNNKLWREVATAFGINVGYCKTKWGSIRVSFARQIRNENMNDPRNYKINWYLKDNMDFLRKYMRSRDNKDNKNRKCKKPTRTKIINKSNLELLREESNLSGSASEVKNELIFEDENDEDDENESLASLEFFDEDILDENKIDSLSSVPTSERVGSEKQTTVDTCTNSNYQEKRLSEQKAFPKSITTDHVYKTPLRKQSSRPESLSNIRKEKKSFSLAPAVQEDKTMTFFKSIFHDVNKLNGRRQRQLKQKLMEHLNELLDEQENES
ncbi:DNA ligase 1-like [Episyrphus balteatus]|uniref:DNA ligase 1-like n=1 Tax=Episyrphus balteatus TaxID=286459 RepID=UPI002486BC57|nr:DNA ligase 1-like [Episyrphus balteatus]